jgi:hypothetical protein
MLFKRQKLLLTLLEKMGEALGHTDFQKLLFLYVHENETLPSYEFVPYRYGCFSFTSYADKRKLIREGMLTDDDQIWQLEEAGRAIVRRQPADPGRMASFCRRYGGLRGNALIAEVYRRHPYYAMRSEILDNLRLEPEALARISELRPGRFPAALLTIGYEGRSLEAYLNELLRASLTLVCDVRQNPLSRKYGFSKGTLSKACEGVGIRYEHIPELGIAFEARRNLQKQKDYDELFAIYEKTTLPKRPDALRKIQQWVADGERVALTCFERLPMQCHRHCIAKALEQRCGHAFAPQHL